MSTEPSGEYGTPDIFSPFLPWRLAAHDETQNCQTPQDEPQAPQPTSRSFRKSASRTSSILSVSGATQQHPRQKRLNLRDVARDAIKAIREKMEAKQIVVAEALYGFYNTEISLHFLHALSMYFIRVAQEISERRHQRPPTPPPQPQKGLTKTKHKHSNSRFCEDRERSALLREVGRSYARVVMYCSNFERTTADALFFESLLFFARMVVAAAVASPSLSSEVDKEFDRILRGGVFHPTPVRPNPRSCRRSLPRGPSAESPRRGVLARSSDDDIYAAKIDDDDDTKNNGDGKMSRQNTFKRSGILETGDRSLCESPGMLVGGGEKRRAGPEEPGRPTGAASTGGVASRTPSATPPTRPGSGREFGSRVSRVLRGATMARSRRGDRGGRSWRSEVGRQQPRDSRARKAAAAGVGATRAGSSRDGFGPLVGGGGVEGLRGAAAAAVTRTARRGSVPRRGGGGNRAAVLLPVFDELSRWKVTRGSVSRMVRLSGESQSVALSNLALVEEYRRSVAAAFLRHKSSALPATNADTTNNTPAAAAAPAAAVGGNPSTLTRAESASPSPDDAKPPSAAGVRAPFWKRRGRELTSRRKPSGGIRPPPDRGHGGGEKDFFSAEALSVCIASVIEC